MFVEHGVAAMGPLGGGGEPGADRLVAGNLAVAAVGVALAAVGAWHVRESGVGSGPVAAGWSVFVNVLLPLLAVGFVLYFYRWTEAMDLVVARWVVGCTVALTVLGAWASFDSLIAGEFARSRPNLVLGANLGALFGAVAGINRARARRNAALVARERAQRQGLVALNHLLRHHVRNGMTIVDGYADELRREGATEEHVAIIEGQSERVVTLVENVQTLVESVSGTTDVEPVDLRRAVARSVADARERYPAATIDADAEPATVRGNEYVGAVLDNLIANAVEHHDGDAHVEVSLEAGDPTVLRVADDGPGVPDAIRRSFDGDGDGDVVTGISGDGIGLYLVATIVRGYGGSVDIQSRDPRGTIVTVELPLA